MRSRVTGVVCGALLLGGCSVDVLGDTAESREERRVAVSGQVELQLITFDGSIEVASRDGDEVLVEIVRRAGRQDDLADLEVRVTQDGSRVVVQAIAPNRRDGFGQAAPSVSFVVAAPRTTSLDARTEDGAIVVRDLTGSARFATGDGGIVAERLSGDLRANTGDGGVTVTGFRGRADVETGDGGVQVTGVLEQLFVRTGDGGVRIDAEAGSVMKGEWRITTGDGAINLTVPSDMDASIEARSGDGRIQIPGVAARDGDRSERREANGSLGRGGPPLRLETGDGQISVSTR